jgi:hypothetical protein
MIEYRQDRARRAFKRAFAMNFDRAYVFLLAS